MNLVTWNFIIIIVSITSLIIMLINQFEIPRM